MAGFCSVLGVTVAVACAAAAFIAHARPDAALGLAARATGKAEQLDQGKLSRSDEAHLLALVHGARWPMTGLVFGWAFVAGATLVWWVG
jgi:hypothetical protein